MKENMRGGALALLLARAVHGVTAFSCVSQFAAGRANFHVMPEKQRFESQDTLSGQDFSFRQNKEMSSAQANETFVVDARFNRALGENGETLGFAKKKFDNDPAVQQQREDLAISAAEKLGELQSKPEVKKWVEDKAVLDNPQAALNNLDDRLDTARKSLERAKNEETPDQEAVKALEKEVAALEKERAGVMNVMNNPELERMRLLEVQKQNPSITQYVKQFEASKAATALMQSNQGIGSSSGNLYADKAMLDDPNLGGDRHLLARAVASHEVDKLIGLNVCAQEKFGQDEQGNLVGVSVQCDGAGVRSQHGQNEWGQTTTAFLDIDYSDPNVQKGLYDLEALDYITGQIDRHQGNIFVDPDTGKVTGIDNDLAFPEVDREQMIANGESLAKKAVLGMPKMMHQDTAAKIAAMDPEELRRTLESVQSPDGSQKLSKAEIDGAVERLQNLQRGLAANPSPIKVVAQFDETTYRESIEAQEREALESGLGTDANNTSYIGSIENERKFTQQKIDAGDELFTKRTEESVGKAKINPEYAAFKQQMNSGQQADYRAMQQQVEKLEGDLAEVRREMAKMQNPTARDKLAALRHGGVDRVRQQLLAKETAIAKELNSRMNGLKLMAAPHVEALQQSQANAQAERQAQKQAVAQSRVVVPAPQNAGSQNLAASQKAPEPAKLAPLPKAAEDEQDVSDLDLDDDDPKVEVDAKKEGLQKKPSVGDMLKKSHSSPNLGGLQQGVEGEEHKPAANSLRASGGWQSAKPSGPKPGGNSLTSSHR